FADMPAGMPLELGAMVVVGSPQGADDRDVVRAGAHMPPPVGDQEPTFAMALVAGVEPHEDAAAAMGRVGGHDVAQPLGIESIAIGSVVDRLAGVAIELRLDIEALDVANAAAQENPDDGFGLRREMRPAIRGRVVRLSAGAAVLEKHGAESESREAHAGVSQKSAPVHAGAAARVAFVGH